MRVGIGFDAHPFDEETDLVIGGVAMGRPGLAGWSDGDVLTHAVIDALLGAAGLGDIGERFPSSQVAQGTSSLELLAETKEMLGRWAVVNIDATVILEHPKLAPHRDRMSSNIADGLGIDPAKVGVKASTADGLGSIGRRDGAACLAVALLEGSE